jgi:hypothetical protein
MGQREIMLHTVMTLQQQQHEISMQFLRALQPHYANEFESMESAGNGTTAETAPNEVRTTQTTANRMSEPFQAEKTLQNMEKTKPPYKAYLDTEKSARYLHDLKHSYILLAQNRHSIRIQYEKDFEGIPRLDARAELMEERIENVEKMRANVAELKIQREDLPSWAYKRKKELDKEIERAEADIHLVEQYFNSKYHIPLHEADFEVKRIRNEARFKERELERKTAKIAEITKELEVIDAEYRAQWQLVEKHAYRGLIENLLTQMRVPQISALDNLHQVQAEQSLDNAKNKKKRKG